VQLAVRLHVATFSSPFSPAIAHNHQTQYTYDNMDRVQTRKDALLNQECYGTLSGGVCQANGYDGNGNLIQFTDRRGKVAKFSYDGLNRMSFAGFGWTTGTTYESTVNYTYDGGNRLRTAVDSISGTITRGYDDLDRLNSDAAPQGTVSSTYDNAGRRASLTVPGQSVVNYSFDAANRLTQITQGSATVQFSYDADNRRTSLTLPNGIVTSYSYDNASQLTGTTYTNGSTVLGNLTYSYDLNGRRTNAGGSYARTNLPNAISAPAYNANNQLTTWGTANLFYDLNGNMTSDGTHSYAWDARNRLNTIDLGNTASFTYDPFGRRATKNILGTSTSFLYDRANAVQEVIGGTNTANSLMGGVDEVFQRTDSVGARSFLSDALGGTLALTDSTGTAQTSYTYEPFGNTTVSGTATTSSFAYTGRELDGTGLYFYRARYYNPLLGRFISEDPIGFRGGTNKYAYVGDNGVNGIDPTGTENPISHFAEAMWASALDPSLTLDIHDPFNPTSDVLTDALPLSQHTDTYNANMHVMAGRKPNGHYQTCSQALQGAADFTATMMNGDNLGMAEHTGQDWATPGHGGAPWPGGFPTSDHLEGDWIGNLDPTYYDARMHNVLWIRQHMQIRTGVPVTAQQVLSNMQGGAVPVKFVGVIIVSILMAFVLPFVACTEQKGERRDIGTVYVSMFQPNSRLSFDHLTFKIELLKGSVQQTDDRRYAADLIPKVIPPHPASVTNSPDGVYAAFLMLRNASLIGHQYKVISIRNVKTGQLIAESGLSESEVEGVAWSPRSDAVAVLTASQHYSLNPKYWLYALSGHPIPVEKYRLEIVDIDHRFQWGIKLPYETSAGYGEIRGWD